MAKFIDSSFSRKNFYKAERKRVGEQWRRTIREVLLLYPRIEADRLRAEVIRRVQLRPLGSIGLGAVQPAKRASSSPPTEAPSMIFRNLVTLHHLGDPRLFAALGSGRPIVTRPMIVTDDSVSLVYDAEHDRRATIEEWANADLPQVRSEVESQRSRTEHYNLWATKAADSALAWFADHIAVWRAEGALDWARLRAT